MARVDSSFAWVYSGFCLLVLVLLAGCSRDPQESPEEQIRALLDTAELAVESRSLSDSAELISSTYTDAAGRDHQAMKRLLMGYFLRNKSIHVLKQIREISLLSDAAARVVLYAGVAGNRPEIVDSLASWRGDLIRLEAELVLEGSDWHLSSASWRRASQGDLL
ncbi:MAG: hypothetical protein ABFS39_02460 [Pseudomonadota bacterium]